MPRNGPRLYEHVGGATFRDDPGQPGRLFFDGFEGDARVAVFPQSHVVVHDGDEEPQAPPTALPEQVPVLLLDMPEGFFVEAYLEDTQPVRPL